MTRQEAINILKSKMDGSIDTSYEWTEAIRMAIQALKQPEPCKDTISRQAAIDALMAWEEDSFWDKECVKHRGEPYWIAPSDVIEQLPPAEPERKTGKWILKDHMFECDKCGCRINRYPFKGNIWNYYYCQNCGARMEGVNETD